MQEARRAANPRALLGRLCGVARAPRLTAHAMFGWCVPANRAAGAVPALLGEHGEGGGGRRVAAPAVVRKPATGAPQAAPPGDVSARSLRLPAAGCSPGLRPPPLNHSPTARRQESFAQHFAGSNAGGVYRKGVRQCARVPFPEAVAKDFRNRRVREALEPLGVPVLSVWAATQRLGPSQVRGVGGGCRGEVRRMKRWLSCGTCFPLPQHPLGHQPPCTRPGCMDAAARGASDCTHYCTRCVGPRLPRGSHPHEPSELTPDGAAPLRPPQGGRGDGGGERRGGRGLTEPRGRAQASIWRPAGCPAGGGLPSNQQRVERSRRGDLPSGILKLVRAAQRGPERR